MHDLLGGVFRALERADIPYCLLRDDERPGALARGGEVDVLVAPERWADLRDVATGMGFADLARWGHAPHHFLVAYDPGADTWLKLDVVTAIAFGRPAHALATDMAPDALRRRRRAGPAYALAPEDALVTLLLHCLLDQGAFPEHHRARLTRLRAGIVDAALVADLLDRYAGPSLTWPRVARWVDAGGWDAMLAERRAVAEHLAGRDRLATSGRRLRDPALRKLDRARGLLRPRVPTVALLAPDGAGKTTLAAGLAATFYFPTCSLYMGLYPKGARRSPLARVKGLGLIGRLATQWRRCLVARAQQGRGRLVIFDRYAYDAYLPARRPQGALRRLRRWLLARTCPPPDMAILLDGPGVVLFARKGEHSPAALEAQRQHYLALRPHVPQMMVVDATNDADQVRRDALTLIWRRYAERGPRPAHRSPVAPAPVGNHVSGLG